MKVAGFIAGLVLVVSANLFFVWLGASVGTSAIKALSDDCGDTYVIEKVVSGHWFCPALPKEVVE